MPSPTYQCTKARLEYIKSNFLFKRRQACTIAVVLQMRQQARLAAARLFLQFYHHEIFVHISLS
uniref:Uncharacterized protein n=1 Tax=Romanomermis culicivorax TaxID=13658 RepID=A0A915HKY6_ROMCU